MSLKQRNKNNSIFELVMIYTLISISLLLISPKIIKAQTENFISVKTYDTGFGVGLIGSGELNMDFDPYITKKKASFLIKGFYDTYLIPKLAVGVYVHIASAPVDMHYTETTYDVEYINNDWVYIEREIEHSYELGTFVWEIGASFKPRFFIGKKWAFKPGINVGYRKFYFSKDDLKKADVFRYFEYEDQKAEAAGMGLNGSLEIQY